MCQSVKQLTFCTCEVDPSFFKSKTFTKGKSGPGRYSGRVTTNQAPVEPEEFVWILKRYVETATDCFALGMMRLPKESLNTELTVDNVLRELNVRNCFDFDFEPVSQDYLEIQTKGFGPYIAFHFQDGQWQEGWGHDTFNDIMKQLGMGKVRWQDCESPISEDEA